MERNEKKLMVMNRGSILGEQNLEKLMKYVQLKFK